MRYYCFPFPPAQFPRFPESRGDCGELRPTAPATRHARAGRAPAEIDSRHPQAPRAGPAPPASASSAQWAGGFHRQFVAGCAATAPHPRHPLGAFRALGAPREMQPHLGCGELGPATPAARHLGTWRAAGTLQVRIDHELQCRGEDRRRAIPAKAARASGSRRNVFDRAAQTSQ